MGAVQQRVVLVEDDPFDQAIILEAFARVGSDADLQVASTVAAAVEVLSTPTSIVLVIVDLRLADASGLELIEWMRSEPRTSAIPVVVLSSSDDRTDVRAAYEAGANAYLVKPSSMNDIDDIARRIDAFWLGACSLADEPDNPPH